MYNSAIAHEAEFSFIANGPDVASKLSAQIEISALARADKTAVRVKFTYQ